MIQSAEILPKFNWDRFERQWKKFADARKIEEHSATLERRNLRAKNRRYNIYN